MTIDSGHKPALHKKHVARLQREKQQSKIILICFHWHCSGCFAFDCLWIL